MVLKSAVGVVLACAGLSPIAAGVLLHAAHTRRAPPQPAPWGTLTKVAAAPTDQASLAALSPASDDISRHLRLQPSPVTQASTGAVAPPASVAGADIAIAAPVSSGPDQPPQADIKSTAAPALVADAVVVSAPSSPSATSPVAHDIVAALPNAADAPAAGQGSPTAAREAPGAPAPKYRVRPGMLVDINKATQTILDHLPGRGHIGHAIIAHRPYRSIEELVSRRVLRSSDFQRVRSQITAN